MLTIRMNEAAVTALQPLAADDLPTVGGTLDQDLQDMLAQGLTDNEGALIFTAHIGQWPAAPASVPAAVAKMGWRDLTGYECNYNSFHLEDHAPVKVTILDDGQLQINTEGQVVLLRLGMVVADAVLRLVRALPQPTAVRCIILANDTNSTFRFHRIRPGEDWIDLEDLERYPREMTVVLDSHP
ncbi:hypothetical protein SAMN04489832_5168 [Micromonospora cremea]|uniref:Uncharacterized protein n=1 Tax=Micromonospora cremea TaxID=709881 RepID=A0A1N6AA20_9ACTN|nr:hypothetical protein SAMN04489832_5168 [Micromonospora cremea]